MMSRFGITLVFSVFMSSFLSVHGSAYYNVVSFGGKGNGIIDSTQAFLQAWAAACNSTEEATIYVPKGRYLVGPMTFTGRDCKAHSITLLISGTLVAPLDYHILCNSGNWLWFHEVSNLSIAGGSIDAKGTAVWACKASTASSCDCPAGATSLRITNSNNILIKGLLSLNSQLGHIAIHRCNGVEVERVKVLASDDSPNTDGIHVELSTNVAIRGSSIKTGDDCISIGPGTSNLWIENVTCGPGHGISIGSLAKNLDEQGVRNVTVKKAVFVGTQNGLRIKSWARPSNSFVQRIRFLSVVMRNVQNPILIDQHYCPHNLNCPTQESGVKISDVIYEEIKGTSATPIAVKFDCSATHPCSGIRLNNVNLTYLNNQTATSSCSNVIGKAFGSLLPETCF